MKSLSQLFFAACLLIFSHSKLSAEIMVTFAPTTAAPLVVGSPWQLDVWIHSHSGDVLDIFLVDIGLTPTAGSPLGGLQFNEIQNDSQLADSRYVFNARSLSQNLGVGVGLGSAPDAPFDNFNTFSGLDSSDDGSEIATPGGPFPGNPLPVTLTGSDLLLFRLDMNALAAGTYEIDLLATSAFASDQLDPDNSLLMYSSTPMTLTVMSSAAVPEPATGFVLLIGSAAVCWHKRRSS